MSLAPERVTVRYYNVGFGDCFLLLFHYASGETRSVLIDFGTMAAPGKSTASAWMSKIARLIEEHAGHKLHAVVATHRHRDHVSGFARKANGQGSGDIIARCKPELVLLPWTEDPEIETDAAQPFKSLRPKQRVARGLVGMQAVSAGVVAELARFERGTSLRSVERLRFLGENNLGNRDAMESLWKMGAGGKCRFLHYGKRVSLTSVLPGVRISVLGPPTIAQHAAVAKQTREDVDEFWHLLGLAGAASAHPKQSGFPASEVWSTSPPEARWIRRRLQRLRAEQVFEVVRRVDDALNNTSLILLFTIGKSKLLFPGDAQIENWEYALAKRLKDLRDVRLYKVGHHGSLNATPKTLWNAFKRRSEHADDPQRLVTVCSTKADVHGQKNEVPRKKLIDALSHDSDFRTTQTLKASKPWSDVELDL